MDLWAAMDQASGLPVTAELTSASAATSSAAFEPIADFRP